MIMTKMTRPAYPTLVGPRLPTLVGGRLGADQTTVAPPCATSASQVLWVFLSGITGFGVGLALGTIWGAKALRGG